MDDLTRISGIGKATAERLVAAGIDSFEKLAHDGVAGEHGVKVEWISAAAALLHENSTDTTPSEKGGGDVPDTGVSAVPPAEIADLVKLDTAVHEQWPRLAAALEAWQAAGGKAGGEPLLRIRAKTNGFRRCGIAHTKEATDHPFGRFTPDQVERLLAEPRLTVELV